MTKNPFFRDLNKNRLENMVLSVGLIKSHSKRAALIKQKYISFSTQIEIEATL